jgi:hypothetical protein
LAEKLTLPIKHDLKHIYFASISISILSAVLSIVGLLNISDGFYGKELNTSSILIGQDIIHLVLGIPLLLVIMYFTNRKSIISLLLWPGILYYFMYDYFYFILGMPVNYFFIIYLLIVVLSMYTLIIFLMNMKIDSIYQNIQGISNKLFGVFMISIASLTLLSILFSPGGLIPSVSSGSIITSQARLLWTLDPIFQVPALLVIGISVINRNPNGYVFCGGLLFQTCIFVNGKSIVDFIDVITNGIPTGGSSRSITWIVLGITGLVLLLIFSLFIRDIRKNAKTASTK